MKMIRKFANISLLLLSVASIVPAYGNEDVFFDSQETFVEPEETEVVWYKRTETRNLAVAAVAVVVYFGALFKLFPPEPFMKRTMRRGSAQRCVDFEIGQIVQKYNDDVALCAFYGYGVPSTWQADLFKMLEAVYKKYKFDVINIELGELINGKRTVYCLEYAGCKNVLIQETEVCFGN